MNGTGRIQIEKRIKDGINVLFTSGFMIDSWMGRSDHADPFHT